MGGSGASRSGFREIRSILLPLVVTVLLQACGPREMVRAPSLPPVPPVILSRIEVTACRLASRDEFVDVRFRVHGKEIFHADPAATYLVDEKTGEKYYLMPLKRIGRLPETKRPGDPSSHALLFRNLDGKLKRGARVTLVVDGLRQEHVLVEK